MWLEQRLNKCWDYRRVRIAYLFGERTCEGRPQYLVPICTARTAGVVPLYNCTTRRFIAPVRNPPLRDSIFPLPQQEVQIRRLYSLRKRNRRKSKLTDDRNRIPVSNDTFLLSRHRTALSVRSGPVTWSPTGGFCQLLSELQKRKSAKPASRIIGVPFFTLFVNIAINTISIAPWRWNTQLLPIN